MATATVPAPKRVEIVPVQSVTFKGDKAKESAKSALTDDTKPEVASGIDWEKAVCSQDIDSVTYARAYWKPLVTSVDGILSLAESDPVGVIKDVNYGSMLAYNAVVREAIAVENSGPAELAKSVDKLTKEILKMRALSGKPISEEKARTLALAMSENQ